MLIDVVTIFPEVFAQPLQVGVLGRARDEGLLIIRVHDLRDFTRDRHSVTDEPPYGGGPGMVMKPEPFFRAVEFCRGREMPGTRPRVILLTPQGRSLTHHRSEEMALEEHLILLCPRYEGIDERVRQWVATHELSIGDYVISGGEMAALVVIDAVGRLVPGVLGHPQSAKTDSFASPQLEGPQYTRPARYRGLGVPDVLRSGDHGAILKWHQEQARVRTRMRRPQLLSSRGEWQYDRERFDDD